MQPGEAPRPVGSELNAGLLFKRDLTASGVWVVSGQHPVTVMPGMLLGESGAVGSLHYPLYLHVKPQRSQNKQLFLYSGFSCEYFQAVTPGTQTDEMVTRALDPHVMPRGRRVSGKRELYEFTKVTQSTRSMQRDVPSRSRWCLVTTLTPVSAVKPPVAPHGTANPPNPGSPGRRWGAWALMTV